MNKSTSFAVGDFVKLQVPQTMSKDCFSVGRIESIGNIEDFNGFRK